MTSPEFYEQMCTELLEMAPLLEPLELPVRVDLLDGIVNAARNLALQGRGTGRLPDRPALLLQETIALRVRDSSLLLLVVLRVIVYVVALSSS